MRQAYVDVMSRVFWESAYKSNRVLDGFGLHRGDLGMPGDKKVVCLGSFGFWISVFVDFAHDFDLEFSPGGFGFWISDF